MCELARRTNLTKHSSQKCVTDGLHVQTISVTHVCLKERSGLGLICALLQKHACMNKHTKRHAAYLQNKRRLESQVPVSTPSVCVPVACHWTRSQLQRCKYPLGECCQQQQNLSTRWKSICAGSNFHSSQGIGPAKLSWLSQEERPPSFQEIPLP